MIDTELQTWAQEWRQDGDLLPDLKKKIRRQNRLMLLSAVLLAALMLLSAATAYYRGDSFTLGFASGLWAAAIVAGGYALRVRRGSWKPVSQTTQAYAALVHQRAVAKFKTVRFSGLLLLIATLLYTGETFVSWAAMSAKSHRVAASVSVAMLLELGFMVWYGKRKQRQADKAKDLLSSLQNDSIE